MTITDLIIQYKAELALTDKRIAELKIEKKKLTVGVINWNLAHAKECFAIGRMQKLAQVLEDLENIDD